MTKQFAVVYEAAADFQTATEIADRVLVDAVAWLDESLLDSQRQWLSTDDANQPLTWKSIPHRARMAGIVARGHFSGEPGAADAAAARRALLYVHHSMPSAAAIVLVRDVDNQPQRIRGLEQARSAVRTSMPIVIGAANPKREAWAVCGFEPEDEGETALLAKQRQTLGFDPRVKSHELTASGDRDKRSAKRVLNALTSEDRDRECRCWQSAPLATLRSRGNENGLAPYMEEVQETIVPLIAEQD